MAGTKAGGAKASATNKAKYGEDFYKKIGSEGGKLGHTGGFYVNRELAVTAGRKGGTISRRTKKTPAPADHSVTKDKVGQYEERIIDTNKTGWLRNTATRLGHVIPIHRKTDTANPRNWR